MCGKSAFHAANSRMGAGVRYIHGVVREAGIGRWISWAVMQPHSSFPNPVGGLWSWTCLEELSPVGAKGPGFYTLIYQ